MSEAPTLTILNVGHGLCAVLQDDQGTMLFDVAPGAVPRDYLRTIGVNNLDAVMVSHFHKDHCSGMTGFLGVDYEIEEVFMNKPRSPEESEVYWEIKAALEHSRSLREGRPVIHPFDADTERPVLNRGAVQVTIITPDALDARSERMMHDPRLKQTEHSSCGVVRVNFEGHPRVLLAGDLDRRGLAAVLERNPAALRADILIYPHHGGSATESDEAGFAELLCSHVEPKLVVFSMGRKPGRRPHPEVLEGVASVSTATGVVCTQLSRGCDEREPDHGARLEPLPMLHSAPAKRRRLCCGGSIMIPLGDTGSPSFVGDEEHASFIAGPDVPKPMCAAMTAIS